MMENAPLNAQQQRVPAAHAVSNANEPLAFNPRDEFSTDILKVPIGFLKCLQLPFALLAWSCYSSFEVKTFYASRECPNRIQQVRFGYPFKLTEVRISANSCATDSTHDNQLFDADYDGCSTYFVSIAAVSFLLSLLLLLVYLFLRLRVYDKYEGVRRLDCAGHAVLAALWTWAVLSGSYCISAIKDEVDVHALAGTHGLAKRGAFGRGDMACQTGTCAFAPQWSAASLTIACLAGWACWLLYSANVYFIYRETTWFSDKKHVEAYNWAQQRVQERIRAGGGGSAPGAQSQSGTGYGSYQQT